MFSLSLISAAAAFQQGKIPPTPFSAPPPAGAMIPPPPSLRKSEVFVTADSPLIVRLSHSWLSNTWGMKM